MSAKTSTERNHNAEVAELFSVFQEVIRQWSNKSRNPYVIDDENLEVIQTLAMYFTGHPDFEKQNCIIGEADRKKGLILCGNVGSGKTLLMKTFQQCLLAEHQYRIVPCDMLTDAVRKDGVGALEGYQKLYLENYKPNTICFDDLGIESKAKYFGDTISPMYNLIIKRYRAFTDHKLQTHFTTNLRPNEWAEFYDERTASRLHEMCNVIILGGKANSIDRRKN